MVLVEHYPWRIKRLQRVMKILTHGVGVDIILDLG